MMTVSPSEAHLLAAARTVVGASPSTLLPGPRPHLMVPGLTPVAMDILERTLTRGVALSLLRRGGWTRSTHVVDGEIRRGRVWERHELAPLRFGLYTFELLHWLAFHSAFGRKPDTLGDHVMAYLAADALDRSSFANWPQALAASPLVWLTWPEHLANNAKTSGAPNADAFGSLFHDGRPIIEALQADFARRVVDLERRKPTFTTAKLIAVGQLQDRVLNAYFDAAEDQPDLLRFVIDAGAVLAQGEPTPGQWYDADAPEPLAERALAAKAAAAFLRCLQRRAAMNRRFAAIRFFDDAYDIAQAHLADWSRLPSDGYTRLERVTDALQALSPA